MTQELIANMLGVRREGVTEGALKLQHAGLIQYARATLRYSTGRVRKAQLRVLLVVKKEYDRLLPAPWRTEARLKRGVVRALANGASSVVCGTLWGYSLSRALTLPTAENHLIELLPAKDRRRLLGIAEHVQLAQSDVLGQAGKPTRFIYFP